MLCSEAVLGASCTRHRVLPEG